MAVLPWLIALLAGGTLLASGGGGEKSADGGVKWGPELGADGVQRVPMAVRASILSELATKGAAPAGEHAIVVSGAQTGVGDSAAAWMAREQAAGRAILINVLGPGDTAPAELQAVQQGELASKACNGCRWAVLAEGYGGLPAQPPAQPPPGAVQSPSGVDLLTPLEAQIQAMPVGLRETISNALKNPATQAETLRVLADSIRAQFPAMAAELEKEATKRKSEGMPATDDHVHYVRLDGDNPWALAQHFTGDGNRWRELLEPNNLRAIKDPTTGFTVADPWRLGQKVILPASWDVKGKGPMPRGTFLTPEDIAKKINVEGEEIGARFKPPGRKRPGGKKARTRSDVSKKLKQLRDAKKDKRLRRKILDNLEKKPETMDELQQQAGQGNEIAQAIVALVLELQAMNAQDQDEGAPPPEAAPAPPPDAPFDDQSQPAVEVPS